MKSIIIMSQEQQVHAIALLNSLCKSDTELKKLLQKASAGDETARERVVLLLAELEHDEMSAGVSSDGSPIAATDLRRMSREQQEVRIASELLALPTGESGLRLAFTRALAGDEAAHSYSVATIASSECQRAWEQAIAPLRGNQGMSEQARLEAMRAAAAGVYGYGGMVGRCDQALAGDVYSRELCRLILDDPQALIAYVWENSPHSVTWKAAPLHVQKAIREGLSLVLGQTGEGAA